MIVKFSSRKNLFRNYVPGVIFITRFDLLYRYADLNLKEFIRYWPKIIPLLKKKKFSENTCRMVNSAKYGKLFILSQKLPEPGKNEEIKKQIANFKKLINKISPGTEDSHTYRIDLYSFCWLLGVKIIFKFVEVINSSKEKFEIYY